MIKISNQKCISTNWEFFFLNSVLKDIPNFCGVSIKSG